MKFNVWSVPDVASWVAWLIPDHWVSIICREPGSRCYAEDSMQHSLPVLFAEYPVSHSLITSAVLSDLWMMIRRSDQVLTWPIRRLGWFWSTVLAEHEYYSCSCTSMTSSCNSCSFLHRVRTQSSHGGPLSCRMMVVDEGIFRAVHRSRGNWTDFDG